MSLLTEQKIINTEFTEREPEIFTTGAKLIPVKVDINGIVKYVWVVKEFTDDSYLNGENCSPYVIADCPEKLIISQ